MRTELKLTSILLQDEGMIVAICPELDVASGGATYEEARKNLAEAVELLLEHASPEEIDARLANPVGLTEILEVA